MASGYTYALSEVASEFAFRLPKAEQRRLAMTCRTLTTNPHRPGDYVTTDQTGRPLQNILVDDWVITFWSDHAAREMRIVEIVQV